MKKTKQPSARERAIATIIAEVAKEGAPTPIAVRAYAENGISYEAYRQAVARGRALHRAKPAADDQA